jgi:hypothetical protein
VSPRARASALHELRELRDTRKGERRINIVFYRSFSPTLAAVLLGRLSARDLGKPREEEALEDDR